jgi:uncharacterized lipoprotein NlpE involved in copper resistance
MKKIITAITIITALIGCDNSNDRSYISHIQYVVFYPQYRDTVEASVENKDFIFFSSEGSNFIDSGEGIHLYANSAPYKVIKNYKEYK